ncbi:hypothetical protein [Arsenicicoccus dermatophilus]|uniref:hypothetical protein n=1 Tax=Arsenicicoccus dermatophilus TaxID=1076331 RepID=UPI003916D4DF
MLVRTITALAAAAALIVPSATAAQAAAPTAHQASVSVVAKARPGHKATGHKATRRKPKARVRTITYRGSGVRVHDVRQVGRLRGTSASFQDFVVREAARQRTEVQKGCDVSLYVKSYRTDGFATGDVFAPGCGGHVSLWAKKGGAWGEVWGGHSVPTCKALSRAAGRTVPRGILSCR